MKSQLLWKFLGISLLLIGLVILQLWLSIDYLASNYFMILMRDYNISPTAAHQMFLDMVHRYLVWGSIYALALTGTLSLLLTKRALRPLSQITETSKKIAAGDYTGRVPISSRDEIGQLAAAFNRMADSLQRIEDMRRTMVVNVAHELRTPLTNMRGYLEGLSDGVVPPTKHTFDLLHQETLRLVKLVEDHLQLVKADDARATLRLERVNLEELVLQVLALFRPKFTEKGIIVDVALSNAQVKVLADPGKLAQVFRNLLQNAWHYTPPGGWLRISAEQLPGAVKLVFCNTGDGIAAADLPHIFERFYRTEKSRSREHGGAGIGLAIVKELIEAHGGSVGAESSGGKTWIWFTLPA